MENKELEKAILTIKNYCKNRDCNTCEYEMKKLCSKMDDNILPEEWEIEQ